jgi:hypothetical protein
MPATFMPAAVMPARAMPATAAAIPTTAVSATFMPNAVIPTTAVPTTIMPTTGTATGEPDKSRALSRLARYDPGNRKHKNGAADAPTSTAPGTSTRPVKRF